MYEGFNLSLLGSWTTTWAFSMGSDLSKDKNQILLIFILLRLIFYFIFKQSKFFLLEKMYSDNTDWPTDHSFLMWQRGHNTYFTCVSAFPTFLCRRDLDDVVRQTHVFAEAVSDVVERTVCVNVGMRCDSVNGQIFTQIHLRNKLRKSQRKHLVSVSPNLSGGAWKVTQYKN